MSTSILQEAKPHLNITLEQYVAHVQKQMAQPADLSHNFKAHLHKSKLEQFASRYLINNTQ